MKKKSSILLIFSIEFHSFQLTNGELKLCRLSVRIQSETLIFVWAEAVAVFIYLIRFCACFISHVYDCQSVTNNDRWHIVIDIDISNQKEIQIEFENEKRTT